MPRHTIGIQGHACAFDGPRHPSLRRNKCQWLASALGRGGQSGRATAEAKQAKAPLVMRAVAQAQLPKGPPQPQRPLARARREQDLQRQPWGGGRRPACPRERALWTPPDHPQAVVSVAASPVLWAHRKKQGSHDGALATMSAARSWTSALARTICSPCGAGQRDAVWHRAGFVRSTPVHRATRLSARMRA